MSATCLEPALELTQGDQSDLDRAPAIPRVSVFARLQRLLGTALESLALLADRPFAFLCGLLAVNALAMPYADMLQDARLYAFQVLNVVEGGRFAQDLFFQYGSQDRYSLFSTLLAPVARVLGISCTFFLLYLVGNALYLAAVQRFFRVLFADRAIVALATLAVALTRLPYGGFYTFSVGESFLTPRLFGIVLVLVGLERLLSGRPLLAFAVLAGALTLHPLMAAGGLLIYAGWLLPCYLTRQQMALTLGVATTAVLVVLGYRPLGERLLGAMDAEWLDAICRWNPYQVPKVWLFTDWLRIAVVLATFPAVMPCVPHAGVRRLLLVFVVAAVLGIVGTVVASWLPYALPIQVQTYRVLWVVQLVQVPVAFLLIRQWGWAESLGQRLAALALAGYFALDNTNLLPVLPAVVALGIYLLWHWSAAPSGPEDAGTKPAGWGLAVGLAVWLGCYAILLASFWDRLNGLMEPVELLRSWAFLVSPAVRLLLFGALLLTFCHRLGTGIAFRTATITLWLGYQTCSFTLPLLPAYGTRFRPVLADVEFVKEYLAARDAATQPTVYWPMGRIAHVWFDLRANSYFDWAQLSGNSFHRGTAMEGERRLALVKRFEIDHYRRHELLINDFLKQVLFDIFQTDFDEPPPQREDVLRLIADPQTDVLVLRQPFDGLVAATNGNWFLYDCRKLRAATQAPGLTR